MIPLRPPPPPCTQPSSTSTSTHSPSATPATSPPFSPISGSPMLPALPTLFPASTSWSLPPPSTPVAPSSPMLLSSTYSTPPTSLARSSHISEGGVLGARDLVVEPHVAAHGPRAPPQAEELLVAWLELGGTGDAEDDMVEGERHSGVIIRGGRVGGGDMGGGAIRRGWWGGGGGEGGSDRGVNPGVESVPGERAEGGEDEGKPGKGCEEEGGGSDSGGGRATAARGPGAIVVVGMASRSRDGSGSGENWVRCGESGGGH